MDVHVIASPTRLPPWGDRAAEWPVLNTSVGTHLTDALRNAGFNVHTEANDVARICVSDDVFLTPAFARAVKQALSTPRTAATVFCMGAGIATRRLSGRAFLSPGPGGGHRLPFVFFPPGDPLPTTHDALLAAAERAEPLALDARDISRTIEVGAPFGDDGGASLEVGGSDRLAIHLTHRSLLLYANMNALASRAVETWRESKWRLLLRYVRSILRRGHRKMSVLEKGCRVHPTAVVEGTRVGPGATIGPFAVVKGSLIGPGAHIEAGAHVRLSIIGSDSTVARQTSVFCCVLMEKAQSAQPVMQGSVLGKGATTTTASLFQDINTKRNVRVESERGLLDTQSRQLGCDVGHGTFVGAWVMTAPGRMLPSHATIVAAQPALLRKVAPALNASDAGGATLRIVDGQLTEHREVERPLTSMKAAH